MFALPPPNIDTGTTIDYVIEQRFEVPEGDLDVTIKLTQDTPGLVGMEVDVDAPDSGLSGLVVVFTAPPNPDIGTISQPVPLTGQGVAVRPGSERPASLGARHVAGPAAECRHGSRRGADGSADVRDPQRRWFGAHHEPHDPAGRGRNHRCSRHDHRLSHRAMNSLNETGSATSSWS